MEEDEYTRGAYGEKYDTIKEIGKGAFGSVRLSRRRGEDFECVTKFICKQMVLYESWVPSPQRSGKMIAIEILLLETLKHPNIVKLIDVMENAQYFCLVMERRPNGIDLYEFIDYRPALDEQLICHIFRQVVNAVDYLHSKGIVHRDIKDENVIIDSNFHCELIDFGSAAYYGDNIYFSSYCGTVQYAHPEYFHGEKYRGPEVEMWLLGVLFYTLIFEDAPFHSVDDPRDGPIEEPWPLKEGISQILHWLLCSKDNRATMSQLLSHWWMNQNVSIENWKWEDVLGGKRPGVPIGCAADFENEQVMLQLGISDLDIGSKIKG